MIEDCVADPRLQAVLAAQWGAHGGRPSQASFALHAVVMSSYLDGAWYPVGGSGVFAEALAAPVRAAGGELRANAEVTAIRVGDDRVQGVTLASGETIDARCVVRRGPAQHAAPAAVG